MKLNSKKIADALLATIAEDNEDFGGLGLCRVRTFEDAGIRTTDQGLVLRFEDGSEFQLTIVQSKRAW